MARRHGRVRRGQRLVAAVPHGHWKTTTFLAALRHDRISAPCVFDGAINGERFLAYVEQVVAPTLCRGDVTVLDNLGAHKIQGVRAAIEAAGAELRYRPPYSPDLNPIEHAFAKLKALLRSAPGAPSKHSGRRSLTPSTPSPRPNAPTTSPTPAMFHLIGNGSKRRYGLQGLSLDWQKLVDRNIGATIVHFVTCPFHPIPIEIAMILARQ
jgi:transposase